VYNSVVKNNRNHIQTAMEIVNPDIPNHGYNQSVGNYSLSSTCFLPSCQNTDVFLPICQAIVFYLSGFNILVV